MSLPTTFFVSHTSSGGSLSGEAIFTKPGLYSFEIPDEVVSICAVCVGGGGGAGNYHAGAGGGLGWKNNISVTPGSRIDVVVGDGGSGANIGSPNSSNDHGTNGQDSYVQSLSVVSGRGGQGRLAGSNPSGGSYSGDGGGNGGNAHNNSGGTSGAGAYVGNGGGGAGGYTGNGGGGGANGGNGSSGSGGAGGGGGSTYDTAGYGYGYGGGGGGVGLYGTGTSGSAGTGGYNNDSSPFPGCEGGGGSGGGDGDNSFSGSGPTSIAGRGGGTFGGGGGNGYAGGAHGGVRIIWGEGRAFPTTDVGTDYNPMTFVGDIGTNSVRFNGNNFITVDNGGVGLLDDSQSSWELTVWARSNDTDTSSMDMGLIIDQYDSGASGRLLFGFQSRTIIVRVDGSTNNGLVTPGSDLEDDMWYHVCFNWDGQYHRLFLDGVRIATTDQFSALYTGKNTQIGGGTGIAGYDLNGYLQDLKITHNQPVNTTDFNVPTSSATDTTGTVLLCCQGNSIVDSSSNGLTLLGGSESGGNPAVNSTHVDFAI
jgi:hypothetical protein